MLQRIQPKVHRYFERMDIFTRCDAWLEQDRLLDELDRFDRKPDSERLLELTPIASEEDQNAEDVQTAVHRIRHILTNLVQRDTHSVGDTPQPLKGRGFLGQPAHWRAYAPTDVSSPFHDVDCGVVIAIEREATAAINPAIR